VAETDPCTTAAGILGGTCPRERLSGLPSPELTRLAQQLLQRPEATGHELAFRMLTVAAQRNDHGAANLQLARLYDPATFQPGGPVPRTDATVALRLYAEAAASGASEASRSRDALIARLRTEAAGSGAAAEAARRSLQAAGQP
jgi:hypothetical protein